MRHLLFFFLNMLALCTAEAQFTRSYVAGSTDPNGNFMGGTEMRVLATHKGMLFGGTETWMDDTTGTCDPFLGAQILRLETPGGPWLLDKHFDTFFPQLTGRERKRNEGVTALESVVFRNDQNGIALPVPDTILIAAARDFTGVLAVYTRNDLNGQWVETPIGAVPLDTTGSTDNDGTVRSFILYRDKVTGIDRIFAGALPNGIISGVYDPAQPSKILWDTLNPELTGFVGRPMAFTVCNGDLFCAIAPGVWKRNDGPVPTWTSVFTYPFVVAPGGSSGLRGLSTIKNPTGGGESLIAALEGQTSRIYRLTPTGLPPYPAVVEYDIDAAMSNAFGFPGNYYVVANSEMTWLTEPGTGDSVLTITIQHHPANVRDDAFYLIRKQVNGTITYALKNIDNTYFGPYTVLNSTRAIKSSPFPNDSDHVYVGGYDADGNISHNTAYVLRASKDAFFSPMGNTPADEGLKHRVVIPSLTDVNIDNAFGYHQTYRNTAIPPLNKLFLFLPGSNSNPFAYDGIQKLAAEQGYHVLGLSYSNATISPLCAGTNDSLCFDNVRNEVISGVDLSDSVAVNPANAINNRLLKALQYLNVNFPTENWGQFYSGQNILWEKMAVSGHSQGGGHAALLAKQHVVDRVVLWASPKDYFVAPLNRAAPWINLPSATAACKYYAFVHQNDNLGCTPAQQFEIFTRLGIDTFAASPVIFETAGGVFGNNHIIVSALPGLSGSTAHNIVAVDVAAANICGVPYFSPAWRYMMINEDCAATGLQSDPVEDPFSIFPNPTNTVLYMSIASTYQIFDIAGALVAASDYPLGAIDVSGLASGVYIIKATNQIRRFIKY